MARARRSVTRQSHTHSRTTQIQIITNVTFSIYSLMQTKAQSTALPGLLGGPGRDVTHLAPRRQVPSAPAWQTRRVARAPRQAVSAPAAASRSCCEVSAVPGSAWYWAGWFPDLLSSPTPARMRGGSARYISSGRLRISQPMQPLRSIRSVQ